MQADNKEVADKLREMADLLDLGLACVRSAMVTDTRSVLMRVDGSHYTARYQPDYMELVAVVEGSTEEHNQMSARVAWSFKPEN